jgi:hypothetical protein
MSDAARQTLATDGSRNRGRPCPSGAFYGQAIPPEGAFYGQEATMPASDPARERE